MANKKNKMKQSRPVPHKLSTSILMVCAMGWSTAHAVEIDTGNDDLKLRFDNTFRYNLGKRVENQSTPILKNPNYDDGDRNFKKNSIVNNRLDILSESDLVYKDKYGARMSAALWYDDAYSGGLDNDSLATSNHLGSDGKPALGLSRYANRYYEGPSGEILDAFVFGTFNLGDSPLQLRAGRHTVNWGESLLGSGAINGISYGQAPLDQGKALALPGIEAKELYIPRTQLSAQFQATPEWSFGAQYFLEWRPTRVPESGSYLGFSDIYLQGGESYILSPKLRATHGDDIEPKDVGDWGLMARWSPEWLDGTLGFYVRNFSDTVPQVILLQAKQPQYFMNYASDIDMYGISLSKEVAGISFGADLNYRHNMPLASSAAVVTSAKALPDDGDILGARGDTLHGVVNALGSISSNPLFDSATWATELTWSHWVSVNSDPMNLFKGSSKYRSVSTNIDAVDRNAYTMAVNFTPTWYQVFPGGDLSMPVSYSVGLNGNSAVALGGSEDAGSYAAGLGLDLYSRYRFDLKYVDYFGDYSKNASGAALTPNGSQALLEDRGAVYFTFKTSI
ncbi:DUF1302 domain-containing protein [Pseudomonas sp. PDM18]|uniref:DUF1302 domain-containing protein n=3 Tax=Pseudomonadaceae TaxID=135621 RepID=A0A5R9AFR1_PSENT|nr:MULTISPECIES: DUF1302 domain-containing protein [Pseudomonas]MBD9679477.1 DUF1302 domain-containing protein [Pseudomonas sp. PDM18]QEY71742.1 DUF1302 domain-containing protein [Pseudomonas denitrificans (nom. rej.)]TLP77619.1 DUF1302 domain-containing protein [Pseudomonas nitroreducens]